MLSAFVHKGGDAAQPEDQQGSQQLGGGGKGSDKGRVCWCLLMHCEPRDSTTVLDSVG